MVSKRRNYQRFAVGGAVRQSEPIELDTPAATLVGEKVDDDDTSASKAFQIQIDALRNAEKHVAQAAERPQHNLTPRQEKFLQDHPEMMDGQENQAILSGAILAAHGQGFTPDSDEFHKAVADNFRLHHLNVASANKAFYEGHQPGTPEHRQATSDHLDGFIERVNDSPPKRAKSRAADDEPTRGPSYRERYIQRYGEEPPIVSNSNERTAPSAHGDRPGRVTLTAEQKMAASISNISETEYAAQLLRLREAKKNGEYLGQP